MTLTVLMRPMETWTSHGIVDSTPPQSEARSNAGTDAAKMAVATGAIVEGFDVIEARSYRSLP
jgi:hypothetical protein